MRSDPLDICTTCLRATSHPALLDPPERPPSPPYPFPPFDFADVHRLLSRMTDMPVSSDIFFSAFKVTSQVFIRTPLTYGLVNLKPILPGHVLVCPRRVVPRLSALTPEEITDLFLTVQKVGSVIEKAYGAEALTISTQDGPAAGQSVPHVHVHLLPRKFTDFQGNNDEVYPLLEASEGGLNDGMKERKAAKFKVDADEDRPPRTMEEMEKEARWLEGLFAGVGMNGEGKKV